MGVPSRISSNWCSNGSSRQRAPMTCHSLPEVPPGDDGRRLTDFALGMQWVGKQVLKLINMPMLSDEQGEQP